MVVFEWRQILDLVLVVLYSSCSTGTVVSDYLAEGGPLLQIYKLIHSMHKERENLTDIY